MFIVRVLLPWTVKSFSKGAVPRVHIMYCPYWISGRSDLTHSISILSNENSCSSFAKTLTFFHLFSGHVVLHRTVRQDSKIFFQNFHFHHSFCRKRNFVKFWSNLTCRAIRFSCRVVPVSSMAVPVSSSAVLVLVGPYAFLVGSYASYVSLIGPTRLQWGRRPL